MNKEYFQNFAEKNEKYLKTRDYLIRKSKSGDSNPSILLELASLYLSNSRYHDALLVLKQYIDTGINNPKVYNDIGICYRKLDQHSKALNWFKKTILKFPSYDIAYFNLANTLKDIGQLEKAITFYIQAIAIESTNYLYHYNLANLYSQLKFYEKAIIYYESTLRLNRNFPDALNNYAIALSSIGRYEKSLEFLKLTIRLFPNHINSYFNLGNVLRNTGRIEESIFYYDKYLEFKPDSPEALYNKGISNLIKGNFKKGFKGYQYRFYLEKNPVRPHFIPKARESTLLEASRSEKFLILSEQGLGDTIQFMRYIPYLRAQNLNFLFSVQSKLLGLIEALQIDKAPISNESTRQYNQLPWISLMSLSHYLNINEASPYAIPNYSFKPTYSSVEWSNILSKETRPIIGINWQSDPRFEKNTNTCRSFPLSLFKYIIRNNDIRLLSLQKMHGIDQLENCDFLSKFVSCQSQINKTFDFVQTAVIIQHCDLIITSDTVVAHIAGALAKPTWLLLNKSPDWRWGRVGDRSFWYPSFRLFRLNEYESWSDLFEYLALQVSHYEFTGNL